MKYKYTFSVLRYVHDVVSGEFVNVALLFHCPEGQHVSFLYERRYSRVSQFFGESAGLGLSQLMSHMQNRFSDVALRLFPARDALDLASQVLPKDDSSLQFSEIRGGVCYDPKQTATDLFFRYVERYLSTHVRHTRSDEDVHQIFRRALRERKVAPAQVQPRTIAAGEIRHEFRIAWKNDVWHTAEPLSMDLLTPDAVVDKATKWLGRGTCLAEGKEQFKIHFLVGAPSVEDRKVRVAFDHAIKIIKKIPIEHVIHDEANAAQFADVVATDLALHSQG